MVDAKRPRHLDPVEILTTDEIHDQRHYNRVVLVTMLGCFVMGLALGFVTGFLLKQISSILLASTSTIFIVSALFATA